METERRGAEIERRRDHKKPDKIFNILDTNIYTTTTSFLNSLEDSSPFGLVFLVESLLFITLMCNIVCWRGLR